MRELKKGEIFGRHHQLLQLDKMTLTDTEYIHDKVDWHYHAQPYFTFILQGQVTETNKKQSYSCTPGTLLFHHWDDAHYNIKSKQYTRGFHIELDKSWLTELDIPAGHLRGSVNITDPEVKNLMYLIFKESKMVDDITPIAIDSLLASVFGRLNEIRETSQSNKPVWVHRVRELLHDSLEWKNVEQLAHALNIHPAHLSRDFSRYFHCHIGDYMRNIRLQKALRLLPDKRYPLTDIAFKSGYADQSHFIRSFKAAYQVTPLQYRQLLLKP